MKLSDYPYDPNHGPIEMMVLPKKLTAIQDPVLRELIWKGWQNRRGQKRERPPEPDRSHVAPPADDWDEDDRDYGEDVKTLAAGGGQ